MIRPFVATLLLVAGCATMTPPAALELGPAMVARPVGVETSIEVFRPGEGPVTIDASSGLLNLVAWKEQLRAGSHELARARHPISVTSWVPEGPARRGAPDEIRGTCVIVPGILGPNSSRHAVGPLLADDWAVVVVWPPVVPRVQDDLARTRGMPDSERGASAGLVVNELIEATAEVAQLRLLQVQLVHGGLRNKPVILVGESMGALAGVGMASTGLVPHDAAVFIAGGGGYLDVARETSIRGILLANAPLESEAFRSAFEKACDADPLRAAARLVGGPVVFVGAEADAIVPVPTQEALWQALGEPPRYRWSGGHLGLFMRGRETIAPILRAVAEEVSGRSRAAEAVFEALPDVRPAFVDVDGRPMEVR